MKESFRTLFEIPQLENKIDYNSKIIFIGSCFSENISERLDNLKYTICNNPFGIIYNPVSISMELAIIMMAHKFTEQDIFMEDGVYKSFFMHSRISDMQKENMLRKMNDAVRLGNEFLKSATHIFITPGTSRVHVLKSNDLIVANNHKQPSDLFLKKQLDVAQISTVLRDLVKRLQQFNNALNIIFTVSPVRHIKEGVVENMHSKAVLINAIHETVRDNGSVSYFPAYEIMMDDLRDYRFYEADMIHPSEVAINYIFGKLKENYIDEKCYATMDNIHEIKTAMLHKPFFPETEIHKKFKEKYIQKIAALEEENKHLDFTEEKSYFQS